MELVFKNKKFKVIVTLFAFLIIAVIGMYKLPKKGTYSLDEFNIVDTPCSGSASTRVVFMLYNSEGTTLGNENFGCNMCGGNTVSSACENAIKSKNVLSWFVGGFTQDGKIDTSKPSYTTDQLLSLGNYPEMTVYTGVLNSLNSNPENPGSTDLPSNPENPSTPTDNTKTVYKPTCIDGLVYADTDLIIARASEGYTYSNNANIQRNAGTHQIVATLNSGYKWSDGDSSSSTVLTCTISKANSVVTLSPSTGNVEVGQTVKFYVHSNVAGSFNISSDGKTTVSPTTSGNVSANQNTEIAVTGVSAGSSKVTLSFTPSDSSNYNSVTSVYEALVGGATSTIISVEKPTASQYCKIGLVETGYEQTLTISPAAGYTFSNNKGTNAGSYTVKATLSDKNKYKWNDNSNGEVTFICSIQKANDKKDYSKDDQYYDNPKTGTTAIVFAWIIGIAAVVYAFWYFRHINLNSNS